MRALSLTLKSLFGAASASAVLLSCFSAESTKCGGENGPVCPAGQVCIAELSACINPLETLCANGAMDGDEECDDGNFVNKDGCAWNCKLPRCGDGFLDTEFVETPEICDDGNANNGDGCSEDCRSKEICGDGYPNTYAHGPGAQLREECDGAGDDTTECDVDCSLALCGDGYTNAADGELCDGGDPVIRQPTDTAACNRACTPAVCGDKYKNVVAGEECDNGLYCSNQSVCTNNAGCAGIGDGECKTRDFDCCTASCKNPLCGNGVFEPNCEGFPSEICDLGSNCADGTGCLFDDECAARGGDGLCRSRNGNSCSEDCQSPELCGDGYINRYAPFNEVCDDGKNCANGDPCLADEECEGVGDGRCLPRDDATCGADCLSLNVCGDGVTNDYAPRFEKCDNGMQCPNGNACSRPEDCAGGDCAPRNGDGCSALCDSTEICGDRVVSAYAIPLVSKHLYKEAPIGTPFSEPEACDDGNVADGDGCSSDCLSDESCGDNYFNDYTHIVDGNTLQPELCDDGNLVGDDGCSPNCLSLEACGNKIEDPGEECDDGNEVSGDGCTRDCLIEGCGNGTRDAGEECDLGELNSDSGDCTLECANNVCGDQLVNLALDALGNPKEECDLGSVDSALCDFDCTFAVCGDEHANFLADEFCDLGPGDAPGFALETDRCNDDCTFAFCGDGNLNETKGELCDDGDNDDGDGCSADCKSLEQCGDKVINASAPNLEVCDDGAQCDDGADCLLDTDCATGLCLPRDSDGCSEDCRSKELCGDSYLNNYAPLDEGCDDGNVLAADGCTGSGCKLETGWACPTLGDPCIEVCGDLIVVGEETCDEGALAPSTGCVACAEGVGWSCPDTAIAGQLHGTGGLCTPICGDRLIRKGETCDDGNTVAGDGCGPTCLAVAGWVCPKAGDVGGACVSTCGDALVVGQEECDDKNKVSGDGCDSSCQSENGWSCPAAGGTGGNCSPVCGDGLVRGFETCDEGSSSPTGGCQSCLVNPGWDCPTAPAGPCTPTCGDFQLKGDETCDDGNVAPGDGCTAGCRVETGWTCPSAGGACEPTCLDGLLRGIEECDEGANTPSGGCTDCQIEVGWSCAVVNTLCTEICGDDLEVGIELTAGFCDDGGNDDDPLTEDNRDNADCTLGCLDATCSDGLQHTTGDGSTGADDADDEDFTIDVTIFETDTDCGGSVCNKCTTDDGCRVRTDCQSNFCNAIGNICDTPARVADTVFVLETAASLVIPVATLIANDEHTVHHAVADPHTVLDGMELTTTNTSCSSAAIAFDDDSGNDPANPTLTYIVPSAATLAGCTQAYRETFTYTMCSPFDNLDDATPNDPDDNPICSTATVTVIVNRRPTIDLPTVCVATGTASASVNAQPFFVDADLNQIDDASLIVAPNTPGTTAAMGTPSTSGTVITWTVADALKNTEASYEIDVDICDNIVASAQGCTTDVWTARWTQAPNLQEIDDSEVTRMFDPPAGTVTANFPFYTGPIRLIEDAPTAGITVTVSGNPTGPFDANENTPASGNCKVETDPDSNPATDDGRVVYTGRPVAGPDSCFVQVCEACAGIQVCSVTRIPLAVLDTPITTADGVPGLEAVTPSVKATGVFLTETLLDNDLFINEASFRLNVDPTDLDAATVCGGTVTINKQGTPTDIEDDTVDYLGPTTPFTPAGSCPALVSGRFITDRFTYRACSPLTTADTGDTECPEATVTITINQHPDPDPDTVTINEDTNFVVTYAATGGNAIGEDDSDHEGSPLTVVAVGATSHGSVFLTGQQITFTPSPADFNGPGGSPTGGSFSYTISDGNGGLETATVTVNLTAVVDIASDTLAGTEDTNLVFNPITGTSGASADTFENSAPVVTKIGATTINDGSGSVSVTNGSVSRVGNLLTFAPTQDYNGVVTTFTYTVTSGTVDETANISITLAAVSDVNNDTASMNEDGTPVVTNVLTNDNFENSGRSVTGITQGTNGTVAIVNASTGTVSYTPAANFNGTDSYTYTVTSAAVTETATVNVTVNAVADAVNDVQTVAEDATAQTINVLTNDSFGATGRTITAVSDPAHGTAAIVNGTTGTVSYAPDPDFNGVDSYTYTVTGSGGVTETATVNVTINAGVDIADDPSQTTNEDTAKVTSVLANDTFEDTGRLVTAVTQGTNGTATITGSGTTTTYTPIADFNGTDSYTYTVTAGGVTETATVSVSVTAVADIANDSATINEDTVVVLNVLTNDNFESPARSITAVGTATNGTTAISNGGTTVTYTPNADYNDAVADTFTYTVTSGGVTEQATVSVTVNAVVDGVTDSITTAEDVNASAVTVLANDTFGATPQITAKTNGTHGAVTINDTNPDTVTYDPDPDYHGPDTFTYTVTSNSEVEVVTVNVTVTPITDAFSQTDSVLEDALVTTDVDADDTFTSSGRSVTGVTQGAHGAVSIVNAAAGTVQYNSDPDFNGVDTYTYTVTAEGNTETAMVTITVNPDPDIVSDTVTVNEDAVITFDPVLNSPANGAELDNFEAVSAPLPVITHINANAITVGGAAVPVANGTVSLAAGHELTYTPSTDFSGTAGFTYTVLSGGVTETANITVTVTEVPDPPTITGAGQTVGFTEGGTPLTIDGTLTIIDVDDANMESAAVTITNGIAEDLLECTHAACTASGLVVGGTATALTLTGTATKAVYENALERVTYDNTNEGNPSTTSRTVEWRVNDGDSQSPTGVTSTVTVTGQNDAPVVDLNAGTAGNDVTSAFTEGTPALIAPVGTVTDVDSAILTTLTVTLTARPDGNAIESLSLNAAATTAATTAGFTVTYTASTGVLLIDGANDSAGPSVYQTVLQGILYDNTDDTPTTTDRSITVVANDGALPSTSRTATITVTASNDAPVVDLNGATAGNDVTSAFTEGTPALIAPAGTVTDVDSATLSTMTVTLTARPDGNAIESLSLNAAATTAASTAGFTVTYTASTGVLLIDGSNDSAAPSVFQTVLQGILYDNTDDTPTTTNRTVTVVANDGATNSISRTATITVTASNDPPVVDLNGGTAGNDVTSAFTEGTPALIAPAGTVTDVDSAILTTLTVTLTARPDGNAIESLSLNAAATTAATTAGFTVTYTASTGVLLIDGANDSAGPSVYQTVLQGILYDNTDDTPTTTDRSITVVANDGTANSTSRTATITVTASNDPPVVDLNGATAGNDVTSAFTEGTPALIAPAGTVTDADSAILTTLTVTLTARPDGNAIESLSLNAAATTAATTAGFTVTYTASTGVLLIDGANDSAGPSVYQTVLQGILYDNTDDTPTITDRSITVVVNDGTANSTQRTATITVAASNDAPTFTGTFPSTLNATEETAIDYDLSALDFSDADIGAGTATITYTTTGGGSVAAVEVGGDGVTVGGTGAARTITGTLDDLETYLDTASNVQFTGALNDTTADSLAVSISDNGNSPAPPGVTNLGTTTVNIANVNDPPTLGNGTLASVPEDDPNPPGQTVTAIFTGQFSDPDPGASFAGIAVVGHTDVPANGAWQYSPDSGTNWFGIGTVSDGATARALSASTRIRFLPAANFSGSPTALTVRALDNTYGGSFSSNTGATEIPVNVDTTTNGGTTAIADNTTSLGTTIAAAPESLWINEIHYDNTGGDTGESVEIAGPPGFDLTGWSLVFYNGADGASYATVPLTGMLVSNPGSIGLGLKNVAGPGGGIQNDIDGIALVNSGVVVTSGAVVQFLSYEGTFTATNGPANTLVSTSIGVTESESTPVGNSLQLTGTGCDYDDFTWAAAATATPNLPNNSQTLSSCP